MSRCAAQAEASVTKHLKDRVLHRYRAELARSGVLPCRHSMPGPFLPCGNAAGLRIGPTAD